MGEKHYLLDVRGGVCPYPQLLTLRTLSELTPGDTLEVVLDNPPSVRDIPSALTRKGYKVPEVLLMEEGVWKITITL
ncbi:sulfurtransferase TusA family protein [Candidatus Bathyarchaeota archaeon]|nr:sulfurtransferase TusA family protein [Candidatus Bathyarchaeota archaeon]